MHTCHVDSVQAICSQQWHFMRTFKISQWFLFWMACSSGNLLKAKPLFPITSVSKVVSTFITWCVF